MASAEPTPVAISEALLHEAFREARARFPAECCGWLSGPRPLHVATRLRPCENVQASGVHPTQAQRTPSSAYVIGGTDLLALSRELDGPEPAKVIVHSHVDGRAYFSETDRVVATSPWGDGPVYPVQQLVIGIGPTRVHEAALFAWSPSNKGFIEIARFDGAQI